MKKGQDIVKTYSGIKIIHQKVAGKKLATHHHIEHEFIMPLSGEITVSYLGQKFCVGPGKMVYIPPHCVHEFSSSDVGVGERVIWLIDDKLWKKYCKEKFDVCNLNVNSLAKELIFYLMINLPKKPNAFIQALIESLSDSIRGSKLDLNHLGSKVQDKRILKSLEFMNSNYHEMNFNNLSKDSGMSIRNFNRLFLLEVGITPKEYQLMLRVKAAKKLLIESKLTITDIALEVGYNSTSKFIEVFKKIQGILPSDFRYANKG